MKILGLIRNSRTNKLENEQITSNNVKDLDGIEFMDGKPSETDLAKVAKLLKTNVAALTISEWTNDKKTITSYRVYLDQVRKNELAVDLDSLLPTE